MNFIFGDLSDWFPEDDDLFCSIHLIKAMLFLIFPFWQLFQFFISRCIWHQKKEKTVADATVFFKNDHWNAFFDCYNKRALLHLIFCYVRWYLLFCSICFLFPFVLLKTETFYEFHLWREIPKHLVACLPECLFGEIQGIDFKILFKGKWTHFSLDLKNLSRMRQIFFVTLIQLFLPSKFFLNFHFVWYKLFYCSGDLHSMFSLSNEYAILGSIFSYSGKSHEWEMFYFIVISQMFLSHILSLKKMSW